MAGLPPAPSARAGGGSRFAPPVQTPAPVRPAKPTAAPARFVAPQPTPPAPAASPIAPRSAVPGRGSMQQFKQPEPDEPDEIELTPAAPKARPKAFDPSKVSASWIGGQQPEEKKSSIGMIGLIAAAAVLAGLVFLGVKMLILDKQ